MPLTRFLTEEPSRANCHCASWCWTLGLLALEVLRHVWQSATASQ
ncbi:hypothetical protein SynA1560_02114 [Synechococcus sp. A15-60]|nr:hypothetical protein SynA1560_02114 [Synechococcus sp. A15-60]